MVPNTAGDAAFPYRSEALATLALQGSGVVPFLRYVERPEYIYMLSRLAPGGDLRARLERDGRYEWAAALRLLQPLCAALGRIHAMGWAYGDLKPGNIVLDAEGSPLLIDFSLARRTSPPAEPSPLEQALLPAGWWDLRPSSPAGTPAYAAPELWDLAPPSPAADVYALGCLVYELLTGRPLFQVGSAAQAAAAHQAGPQLPSQWPAGAPASLSQALAAALSRDPAARPSAGELYRMLARETPD